MAWMECGYSLRFAPGDEDGGREGASCHGVSPSGRRLITEKKAKEDGWGEGGPGRVGGSWLCPALVGCGQDLM